jgi:hypothetical protein
MAIKMWDFTSQLLQDGRVERFMPTRGGLRVSYKDVLRLWQDDGSFRTFFISILSTAGFSGYRWETPPVTKATVDRQFEFVLLDAPGLDRAPDERAFAGQFGLAGKNQGVVSFPNLGNDAVLVVPCACGPLANHVHLAAFMRNASDEQKHELWRVVGKTMEDRLGRNPVWLSTAGMGVAWLHVRLDSTPKYYGFSQYRSP